MEIGLIFFALLPLLFLGVFATVIGTLIFRVLKHGGFKAAFFGAPLGRTVGEMVLRHRPGGIGSATLRIHALQNTDPSGPKVGVEIVDRTFASWHMRALSLTADEALTLMRSLEKAMEG
jgi:hypothetical protein